MRPSIDRLIRKGGDPILRQVCTPIEPGEPLPWLPMMARVCREAPGVGLGAPQVGHARRVIYTLVNGKGRFYINPIIEGVGEQTDVQAEGCLSYPGVRRMIERPTSLTLRFLDDKRRGHVEFFDGFIARVIQHECDHLDGVCKVGDPAYALEVVAERPKPRPMAMSALVAMTAS